MKKSNKPRILVIDDDTDLLETLVVGLSMLGYEVVMATNGNEGLEKLSKGNFDVVLCDLIMPGLSGTQVLERIHTLDANIPVLMITAHPTIETAVGTMAEGAYEYIEKPFTLAHLELRIRRTIEAQSSNERARSSRVLSIILLLSIPFWIILGLVLALVFR